ncbi:DUF6308 family protein [Rhodococcus opacus]|uniref:Uncharacterized protein n=1 Tax=Rhodococcus opacus (strain B4) TaxID=632772 RepID=C1B680_RHOOB|nr:DUF6308 family protein [Rhodococcus opacus]BAH55491.1 hypothetical protein ROP_72440 [Rhodococcus opacus B4]
MPGIGRTKATKLIARKRPRLYPIWDSVVSQVLGTERAHLNPVREALRADDAALHHRLLNVRDTAGLPEEISALRVFDLNEQIEELREAAPLEWTPLMPCRGGASRSRWFLANAGGLKFHHGVGGPYGRV